MSRAPGQKNPGPMQAVVREIVDGGWSYVLSCGHTVEREPRVVARWSKPPQRLACEVCGKEVRP